MSSAGRRLLDDSEWIIESAALLPTPDPVVLSCVSFMLDSGLQDRADALPDAGVGSRPTAEFLYDAIELEVGVDRVLTLDSESWSDGFRELAQRYGEVSGLRIEGGDFADLLGEIRVPIFESMSKRSERIKNWGQDAIQVVGAVGTIAGGHAGAVLVFVAPLLGAAIVIGTWAAIGGAALAGYIKRRRQAKMDHLAVVAEQDRLRDLADAEEAARLAEIAEIEAMHARAVARQQALKARLAARPRLVLRPGPDPAP